MPVSVPCARHHARLFTDAPLKSHNASGMPLPHPVFGWGNRGSEGRDHLQNRNLNPDLEAFCPVVLLFSGVIWVRWWQVWQGCEQQGVDVHCDPAVSRPGSDSSLTEREEWGGSWALQLPWA